MTTQACNDVCPADETQRAETRFAAGAIPQTPSPKPRVFFFGHFGLGNLGNESTLQAMIWNLRRFLPDHALVCICTGPEATAKVHQIDTLPVSRWTNNRVASRKAPLRWIRTLIIGVPVEAFRWLDALRLLRPSDVMIVPGTGLVNDSYSLRGWGPYSLFKWCSAAKLRGCKLLFVSVGAGPLHTRLGRWLAKAALSLADFRSYRDVASREFLARVGFCKSTDRVYPDLAFSLPGCVQASKPSVPRRRENRRRQVVGVGVMLLNDRYTMGTLDKEVEQNYIASLVTLTAFLLTRNNYVRMLIGDFSDRVVVKRVKTAALQRTATELHGQLVDEMVDSVDQLLAQIADTDLVVATRYHNLLLALLLNKPVIAISFHQKCSSLMSQMGLSEYCLPIEHVNAQILIAKLCKMEENAPALRQMVLEKVDENRRILDEQYERIFDEIASAKPHLTSLTGSTAT